jgi:hypothetical protein
MAFALGAAALASVSTAQDQPLPPDDQYVVIQDGHLSVGGQRVRIWAAIGKLHADSKVTDKDTPEQRKEKVARSRQSTDALLDRFEDLGFNGFRLWRGFNTPVNYTPGDGSAADDVDYFLAQASKRGMKVWLAGLNNAGDVKPSDVDIIEDPATADAWTQAVEAMTKDEQGKAKKWDLRNNVARFWDPRLEALAISRMKNVATHVNRHTGLRWCDDPVFGVWELSNEEWWMRKMVAGQWQKLAPFFRNSLVAKWNTFLKDKYGSDDKLKAAWGNLLAGESLDNGSVLLLPMAGKSSPAASLNDASDVAKQSVQAMDADYEREDFSEARGSDVMEFFVGLHVSHKQREHQALKDLGKSTRLSPWIYDTGIGYEIQSQFLHQNADASAHDAYVNGTGPNQDRLAAIEKSTREAKTEHLRNVAQQELERISANTADGRWVQWLLKPPGISQGVPWLEHNRVIGQPYLAYETQIQQPAKYRADFPLRIAALASIQDWDWICWHYFGGGAEDNAGQDPRHFEKAMDITTGSHPQGYHYTYDEVQNAMMRAGAWLWRNQALDPAKNPTQFIFGRKALHDPASMDYAGSYGAMGLDMLYTVYQYGVRLKIDPTREDNEVIGPVVKFADRHTHNPYTPTDQITFDWKKGFLEMDAAQGVTWTGLLANYGDQVKFDNADVTISNVSINNPDGIYEPVREDEKYIAFSLYSQDGKPLAQTSKASMSIVSTSFNTGFALGTGKDSPTKKGDTPVLVARVGATITAPALEGMKYTLRDWSMQKIGEGVVTGGKLTVPNDQPIFVIELAR